MPVANLILITVVPLGAFICGTVLAYHILGRLIKKQQKELAEQQ